MPYSTFCLLVCRQQEEEEPVSVEILPKACFLLPPLMLFLTGSVFLLYLFLCVPCCWRENSCLTTCGHIFENHLNLERWSLSISSPPGRGRRCLYPASSGARWRASCFAPARTAWNHEKKKAFALLFGLGITWKICLPLPASGWVERLSLDRQILISYYEK